MTALTGSVIDKDAGTPIADAGLRAYRTLLWLGRGLNAYSAPDTDGKVLGRLDRGDYPALEVQSGPAKGSDYVLVAAENLPGGQGWICSRWRAGHYALLHETRLAHPAATTGADGAFELQLTDPDHPTQQLYRLRVTHQGHRDGDSVRGYAALDFVIRLAPLERAVREAGLVDLLHHFRGWFYAPLKDPAHPANGRYIPRYPYDIGITLTVEDKPPPRTTYNDCSSFVEALLVRGWLDAKVPGFGWDMPRHRRAMITDMNAKFSSVEVLQDAGIADAVDPDSLPPPWTAMQVWRTVQVRNPATGTSATVPLGHTLLVVDTHPETGRLLTLECNHAFGMNGPGLRCVGGIDAFFGSCYRCPADGYVYDPAVGDPAHGAPPGSPFLAPTGWWPSGRNPVPADWICPVDGMAKAMFRPFCRPPRDWWKSVTAPNWDAFKLTYPERRLARLRLWDLTWMR